MPRRQTAPLGYSCAQDRLSGEGDGRHHDDGRVRDRVARARLSASPWETVPRPAAAAPRGGVVPAGWWSRVGATIVDHFLIAIPTWIVIGIVGIAKFGSLGGNGIIALVGLAYAVLMLTYHHGQTVGKEATSIRVLAEDDQPVGAGRAFGRELLKVVFAFTVIVYLIDVLWPLWQSENRALHDLAAGTRVVTTDDGPPPPGYYAVDDDGTPPG
jgi:uncharacterized RDD family membrane protein YckC